MKHSKTSLYIVLLAFLFSGTIHSESKFTRDYILERNSLYSANGNNGTPGYNNQTFSILSNPGNRTKVLVSAPHSVIHTRNGSPKAVDAHTGSIARILGLTGPNDAKAFVVTNVENSPINPRDPNFDSYDKCSYSQEIVQLVNRHKIKFVLDIHGFAANRPFGLAYGTNDDKTINKNPKIRKVLMDVAAKHGFQGEQLNYNLAFPARNPNTVINKIHTQTGIPSIQVEISGINRMLAGGGPNEYNQIIDFLKDLIQELDQNL